jgi:hypothetical protein
VSGVSRPIPTVPLPDWPGYATDKAIILGLTGARPDTIDPDDATVVLAQIAAVSCFAKCCGGPVERSHYSIGGGFVVDASGCPLDGAAVALYLSRTPLPVQRNYCSKRPRADAMDWVNLRALAVNEENVAGGRGCHGADNEAVAAAMADRRPCPSSACCK